MGKSKGILWKPKRFIALGLGAGLVLSSAGCTATVLDAVRPEVNNNGMMVLGIDQYNSLQEVWNGDDNLVDLPAISSASGSSGSGTGVEAGNTGGTSSESGGPVYPTGTFMTASKYGSYLQSKVYAPLVSLLEDNNAVSSVYLKVYHMGFNVTEKAGGGQEYVPTVGVNLGKQSIKWVGGHRLPEFIVDWLGSLSVNSGVVGKALTNANGWLSSLSPDSMTLMTARTDGPSTIQSYLPYWGNERVGATTLAEYKAAVQESIVGTVPAVEFYLLGAAGEKYPVVINELKSNETTYVDAMDVVDVNRLFLSVNQYPNNICAKEINYFLEDDHCLLNVKIDGWSKTIVVLGVSHETTLEKVLSGGLGEARKLIREFYSYLDVEEIESMASSPEDELLEPTVSLEPTLEPSSEPTVDSAPELTATLPADSITTETTALPID